MSHCPVEHPPNDLFGIKLTGHTLQLMQPCDPALHWDSAALKWIHFQEIYGGVNLVFFHFGGSHLIFNSVLSFSTVPSCASLLYVMLMFVLDYRVVEAIAEAYFRSKR